MTVANLATWPIKRLPRGKAKKSSTDNKTTVANSNTSGKVCSTFSGVDVSKAGGGVINMDKIGYSNVLPGSVASGGGETSVLIE